MAKIWIRNGKNIEIFKFLLFLIPIFAYRQFMFLQMIIFRQMFTQSRPRMQIVFAARETNAIVRLNIEKIN